MELMKESTNEVADGAAGRPFRDRWAAIRREVRSRPFGYTVLALFVLAGPFAAPFLFPQAPPAVAIVGGLAFGLYAALCAVPQKFL
jgi:hypothetical protein